MTDHIIIDRPTVAGRPLSRADVAALWKAFGTPGDIIEGPPKAEVSLLMSLLYAVHHGLNQLGE